MNAETFVQAAKLVVGKHEHMDHYLKRLTHLHLNGTAKRHIIRIENLHLCPNLKVLYLYDNEITKMENLENAPGLTHLHLQNNQISKIEDLEHQESLEKLYLEGNRIQCLEGLERCPRLVELHMGNQALPASLRFTIDPQSIRTLAMSLRVLNLSQCHLSSLEHLDGLRSLEVLDVSKNRVEDLEQVFALLMNVRSLSELDMRENPVTSAPRYREKVITFSSARLGLLDKKDIDPNQRRMMQSHMAHKFRKRQEQTSDDARSNQYHHHDDTQVRKEATRPLKHGAGIHQRRSMQPVATACSTQKKQFGSKTQFAVAGSACRPRRPQSGDALALSGSCRNNNNNGI